MEVTQGLPWAPWNIQRPCGGTWALWEPVEAFLKPSSVSKNFLGGLSGLFWDSLDSQGMLGNSGAPWEPLETFLKFFWLSGRPKAFLGLPGTSRGLVVAVRCFGNLWRPFSKPLVCTRICWVPMGSLPGPLRSFRNLSEGSGRAFGSLA